MKTIEEINERRPITTCDEADEIAESVADVLSEIFQKSQARLAVYCAKRLAELLAGSPTKTYRISADRKSITCLVCNMTSYSPADVENLYCGHCHIFHVRRPGYGPSAIPIPTRRQALGQARRSPGFGGICAQCGCTENNACTGQGLLGNDTCAWANKERTLCTNPDCLVKDRKAAAQ